MEQGQRYRKVNPTLAKSNLRLKPWFRKIIFFSPCLKGGETAFNPKIQRQEDSLILEYRKKCIAEMLDAKSVMPAIVEDYYDIKASIVLVKLRILFTIYLCYSADVDLFLMIHVGNGTIHRVIGSCLYLNKD